MEFDPSSVPDEQEKFILLPEGVYTVTVNGTALKANKNNEGSHVSAEFQVAYGYFQGQKLWHNFNVAHPKPKAEQIGRAQMKQFLKAIGITSKIDLADKLPKVAKGRKLVVDVVHEKDFRDKTKLMAKIKRFELSLQPSVKPDESKVEEIPF